MLCKRPRIVLNVEALTYRPSGVSRSPKGKAYPSEATTKGLIPSPFGSSSKQSVDEFGGKC